MLIGFPLVWYRARGVTGDGASMLPYLRDEIVTSYSNQRVLTLVKLTHSLQELGRIMGALKHVDTSSRAADIVIFARDLNCSPWIYNRGKDHSNSCAALMLS
jgi:hypothetical protein